MEVTWVVMPSTTPAACLLVAGYEAVIGDWRVGDKSGTMGSGIFTVYLVCVNRTCSLGCSLELRRLPR